MGRRRRRAHHTLSAMLSAVRGSEHEKTCYNLLSSSSSKVRANLDAVFLVPPSKREAMDATQHTSPAKNGHLFLSLLSFLLSLLVMVF